MGLKSNCLWAEIGKQRRNFGKEIIPGKNGYGIGPPIIRTLYATAQRRLVHDIVVIERS